MTLCTIAVLIHTVGLGPTRFVSASQNFSDLRFAMVQMDRIIYEWSGRTRGEQKVIGLHCTAEALR